VVSSEQPLILHVWGAGRARARRCVRAARRRPGSLSLGAAARRNALRAAATRRQKWRRPPGERWPIVPTRLCRSRFMQT